MDDSKKFEIDQKISSTSSTNISTNYLFEDFSPKDNELLLSVLNSTSISDQYNIFYNQNEYYQNEEFLNLDQIQNEKSLNIIENSNEQHSKKKGKFNKII